MMLFAADCIVICNSENEINDSLTCISTGYNLIILKSNVIKLKQRKVSNKENTIKLRLFIFSVFGFKLNMFVLH